MSFKFIPIANEQQLARDFDEAVSKALLKHMKENNDYNKNLLSSSFETYEAEFDVKYIDNIDETNEMSMVMKIVLTDNTSCYKIEGESRDLNVGSAVVTEGFATYSGVAWWVEETFTGNDKGLKVRYFPVGCMARCDWAAELWHQRNPHPKCFHFRF